MAFSMVQAPAIALSGSVIHPILLWWAIGPAPAPLGPVCSSTGTWYLDVNGDGQWVAGTDQAFSFGQAGDVPVVGDWSASGKSSLCVFRGGFWIIDMNGNGALDGIGIGEVGFWLGNSSFTPVVTR
jgi:hypothetical protein